MTDQRAWQLELALLPGPADQPTYGGSALPGYNAAAAPPAAKILYRPEEAATLMSISRTAVFGLIRSGDLHTVKIGGRRRIPHNAIEAYITQQLDVSAHDEVTK